MMNACSDFRGALLLDVLLLTAVHAVSAQDLTPKLMQYGHTAWSVQGGALEGTPGPIAQTADGYLWIDTSSGLVRIDGVKFKNWQDPRGKFIDSEEDSMTTNHASLRISRRHFVVAAAASTAVLALSYSATATTLNQGSTPQHSKENPMD